MPSRALRALPHHPIFARVYSRVIVRQLERGSGPERRSELLAGLRGRVVEVGAGTGANFAHYPASVAEVVAVEPEPYLRDRAAEAARGVATHAPQGRSFRVVAGEAAHLPLPDASVDAVVFCLVLCSVDDVGAALAEAARVLRPGGELRILEHVVAPEPGRQRNLQRALDATVWPFFGGGCHCSRDTATAVTAAGFTFTELERFSFPSGSKGPVSPAILGRAVTGFSTAAG
jgi:ubiquinone/menaquinone biosynthesis C-methylase UbiE